MQEKRERHLTFLFDNAAEGDAAIAVKYSRLPRGGSTDRIDKFDAGAFPFKKYSSRNKRCTVAQTDKKFLSSGGARCNTREYKTVNLHCADLSVPIGCEDNAVLVGFYTRNKHPLAQRNPQTFALPDRIMEYAAVAAEDATVL